MMFEFIMQELNNGQLTIDWDHWSPIDDKLFGVYNVLIPHSLMHLVQQDTRG
jgi:hypothetical protein